MLDYTLSDEYRGIIWAGAGRAGKTWGAVHAGMIHGMSYNRPVQALLGGKDVDTIRGNVDEPIFHFAKRLRLPCKYIGNPTSYRIGRQVWEVRGLQDSQSYRRIQGREYAFVFIDELTNVHPDAWDMDTAPSCGPNRSFTTNSSRT